ncbi:MAG TPA: RNA polymerase sigma factor SigJ [Acidimicrobiales bacterium]|nr:RNA polymerase sigma factor SigJ [Acidimicrobiales bacterium]
MDVAAELARHRDFLVGVAYRLLGSVQAAEDVVQDAFVRAERAETDDIAEPRAWLTRIVTRLALDELRSARVRRERYVGLWLLEPLVVLIESGVDLADRVTLDDQLSLALLTVLETLSPAERAVYVLHEAFGVPLHEVADIVGRTPEACRQLASRARRHVRERAPRFDADPGEQARLVEAFKIASEQGDLEALAVLLDENVLLRADGGGVVTAARRPVVGRDRVIRTLVAGLRNAPGAALSVILVNGEPGLLVRFGGQVVVAAFVVTDGRISHIDLVANPEKLAGALAL